MPVLQVSVYTANPDFDPVIVAKGSVAAAGLCKWIHAMVKYDRVARIVAPKRAALKDAQSALATATAALAEKRAMLQEVGSGHLNVLITKLYLG